MRTFSSTRRLAALAVGTSGLVLSFTPPAGAGGIGVTAQAHGWSQDIPIPVDTDGVHIEVESDDPAQNQRVDVYGGHDRVLHLTLDATSASSLLMEAGGAGAACNKFNQVVTFVLSGASAAAEVVYSQTRWDNQDPTQNRAESTTLLDVAQAAGDTARTYRVKICA